MVRCFMFYIVVMVCNIVYVSTCAQLHIDSVSPYYKNHQWWSVLCYCFLPPFVSHLVLWQLGCRVKTMFCWIYRLLYGTDVQLLRQFFLEKKKKKKIRVTFLLMLLDDLTFCEVHAYDRNCPSGMLTWVGEPICLLLVLVCWRLR